MQKHVLACLCFWREAKRTTVPPFLGVSSTSKKSHLGHNSFILGIDPMFNVSWRLSGTHLFPQVFRRLGTQAMEEKSVSSESTEREPPCGPGVPTTSHCMWRHSRTLDRQNWAGGPNFGWQKVTNWWVKYGYPTTKPTSKIKKAIATDGWEPPNKQTVTAWRSDLTHNFLL